MKPHRLTQAALSILFLATQVPALAFMIGSTAPTRPPGLVCHSPSPAR